MEIRKVIRVLSGFIALAACAVRIASFVLFSDTLHAHDLSVAVGLFISLAVIWRKTAPGNASGR